MFHSTTKKLAQYSQAFQSIRYIMIMEPERVASLLAKFTPDSAYSDIRLEKRRIETLNVNTGEIEQVSFTTEVGFGIRVLLDGHWGFYGATTVNDGSIIDAGKKAVKMARNSREREHVSLLDVPVYEEHYAFPCEIDPCTIAPEERLDFLFELNDKMQSHAKLTKKVVVRSSVKKQDYLLVTSEGTRITTDVFRTRLSIGALAVGENSRQAFGHDRGGSRGWESVKDEDWDHLTKDTVETAERLAMAKTIGREDTTIVHDPYYGYLFSHEILGHPAETDRFLGQEAAWAGIAWWSPMLQKQIGVEELNVTDDRTVPGSNGYGLYDDEGVKCTPAAIVRNGILVGTLHNRETGLAYDMEPTGHTRATRAGYMPLTRMGNLYIENGDWTADEVIADTKDGVFVAGSGIPSIDQRRYNYQISGRQAWRIKDGELSEPLRDITIGGISKDVFMSIDAIADDLLLTGVFANCGKGMPMQGQHVGNGSPTMRYKATATGSKVN